MILNPERTDLHHLSIDEANVRGRFTFGFVREPLAWMTEQYHYRRRMRFGDNTFPGDPWLDLPFGSYLAQMVSQYPGCATAFYRYFLGEPGRVHFVGRRESIAEDTVDALRQLGQGFDEQALRASRPTHGSHPPKDMGVFRAVVDANRSTYERFYPDLIP